MARMKSFVSTVFESPFCLGWSRFYRVPPRCNSQFGTCRPVL